jgi:hypothetical protein
LVGGGVTSPAPTPVHSTLLDRYFKSQDDVKCFPSPRIFATWGQSYRVYGIYCIVTY